MTTNRILLIGYNFSPERTGIGKYSGEMMTWLADHGYDCTVITAHPYYPYWRVQEPYYRKRFGFVRETVTTPRGHAIRVLRCPMYVPANPSGLKRMLLDFSFLMSAFVKLTQLSFGRKFDLVVTVAPSFQFGLLGVLYKKLRGGRLLYHIQDMQIEAARDLRMIQNERVINTLFTAEKFIFDQADYVSSISEGMVQKIAEKARKPVVLFPNWTDTTAFYPLPDRAAAKQEFGFAATDQLVLYSGAIGEKQGLEAILYAAQEFREQPQVKLLICGSGPYKQNLEALAARLELPNVVFFPLQPIEKFNAFLNAADVHLVIQKSTASDLVMPSKLTTVLAVGGLALVTANPGTGLHDLVQKYDMGIVVEAENQPALNAGLRQALAPGNDAQRRHARAYAEQYLALDTIMRQFEQDVLGGEVVR